MASVAEVTSRVCNSVKEATKFHLPENEVIQVSGSWGETANRLPCSSFDEDDIPAVALQLSRWPHLEQACGQGQSVFVSLLKLSREDMAKKLKKASGIHVLERR